MTNDEWLAYTDGLGPGDQILVERLMERVATIITAHANRQLDAIQRIERRLEALRTRLDILEEAARPAADTD